ncbi:MAG TPA: DUF4280 domain-containing protein [Candidatus Limnocylindrales bacterium]
MGQVVVNGAMIACPMGLPGTATLSILPTSMVQGTDQPVATIQDMVPMTNIATFGMCTSPANPQVAAATAAALGVLTPQPCLPVIAGPWSPGSSTVSVGGIPALTADSTCNCMWAGTISITSAGQMTTTTG